MDFNKLAYDATESGLVVLQDIRLTLIFIAFVLTSVSIYALITTSVWNRK